MTNNNTSTILSVSELYKLLSSYSKNISEMRIVSEHIIQTGLKDLNEVSVGDYRLLLDMIWDLLNNINNASKRFDRLRTLLIIKT